MSTNPVAATYTTRLAAKLSAFNAINHEIISEQANKNKNNNNRKKPLQLVGIMIIRRTINKS